jgi:hypothetical protein
MSDNTEIITPEKPKGKHLFQPGNPGGPGRPKLTKEKISLPLLFEKHGFDWADKLANLLKAGEMKKAQEFLPFLPYLCFQIHANPIDLKPDNPETSVTNVLDEISARKREAMNAISTPIS